MIVDEEPIGGVCGTSLSDAQDGTEKLVLGGSLRVNVRQVNRRTLVRLGVWVAVLALGLGLAISTWNYVGTGQTRYYSRFSVPWQVYAFTVGFLLLVLAVAWASVWICPGRSRRRLVKARAGEPDSEIRADLALVRYLFS